MRRAALLLFLAACSPADPPRAAAKPTPPPVVAEAKPAAPAPSSAPSPSPAPLPSIPPPAPRPAEAPKPAPVFAEPRDGTYSPSFTIDSLDGPSEVFINGEKAGSTPLSWAFSNHTRWDKRAEEPAPESILASRGRWLRDDGTWAEYEIWIGPGPARDEHVLFARARSDSLLLEGALRLRLPGRRFTLHRPAHVNEESPDFARWNRTLSFELD